jgi:hypothetical protein
LHSFATVTSIIAFSVTIFGFTSLTVNVLFAEEFAAKFAFASERI